MPNARPFAYNTGSAIAGTDQTGNLAIGIPTSGFSSTGLEWWNGPDEDLGYVIAVPVADGSQPTPIPGSTASVGFYRTNSISDSEFINLSEYIANKDNDPQVFMSTGSAKTWLNNNGYWTSYGLGPALLMHLDSSNPSSYSGSGSTWVDLSGNGNNGTITGATYSDGGIGGTFRFSGSNQYVEIGYPIPSNTSYSISAWVKADILTNARNIVSSNLSPFWVNSGTLSGGTAGSFSYVTSPSFPTNIWKYVTYVFDDPNNTATLFINGVQVSQNTSATGNYTSQLTFIGSHYVTSPISFWDGDISQVKIWDGPLTAELVLSDFNSTKTRFGV